jgi:hypothetical protein
MDAMAHVMPAAMPAVPTPTTPFTGVRSMAAGRVILRVLPAQPTQKTWMHVPLFPSAEG